MRRFIHARFRSALVASCAAVLSLVYAPLSAAPSPSSLKDSDAVYSVYGNNYDRPFSVRVAIKDGRIRAIEVVDAGGESPAILKTVVERLVPRILENQSLAVDAVSGATGSSNGIKKAAEEAIRASGGKPERWRKPIAKSSARVVLKDFDVIVVGLGGAGTASYLSAAESGATVFGIETAGKVGGNSTTVGGPMAVNPRSRLKLQKKEEGQFPVDTEELYKIWMQDTRGDAKGDLIRLLIDESGETVDWLEGRWGFSFADEMSAFTARYPYKLYSRYKGDPEDMYANAIKKAKGLNPKNDYALELTAKKLIRSKGEKVIGVEAVAHDGTTYAIYGKSVILATGGFAGSPAMTKKYLGRKLSPYGMSQNAGAGIAMALSAGGALYNVAVPEMTHSSRIDMPSVGDRLSAVEYKALCAFVNRGDAIAVDPHGRRFADESRGMGISEQAWKAGDYYWEIYSESDIKKARTRGFDDAPILLNIQDFSLSFADLASSMAPNAVSGASSKSRSPEAPSGESAATVAPRPPEGVLLAHMPVPTIYRALEVAEETGGAVKADSIAELGAKIGAKALAKEVAAYNSYCTGAAKDPFDKDRKKLVPLDSTGPYYAFRGKGRPYSTCGGLDVDAKMNVLDKDGRPIPGLYAAGTDSMGVLLSEKVEYVDYGGVAHGWALTGGRLAGRAAASFAKDN
jgi:succinate dehydrogenase/fumarate reductase flavoprotein subunit/uncharacterized protein with FMN-binding domain